MIRSAPRRSRAARDWPAYAAALWATVFGIRAVYWALGGTVGLGTVSEGLQEAAAAGDRSVFAALWVVAFLLVVGAVVALATVRTGRIRVPDRLPLLGGRALPGWMLLGATAGAGGLLAAHGASYVSLLATADVSTSEVRWYALLWGPWFLTGGVLYLLTARRFQRRAIPGRLGPATLVGGAIAGIALGVAPQIVAPLLVRFQ